MPDPIRIPYETIVIEKVQTPAGLLRECPRPSLVSLETNGDLEAALGEALISLSACNTDKERIRAWQESEL
jgi:hypothetical protein